MVRFWVVVGVREVGLGFLSEGGGVDRDEVV